jgi:hypothetical protein
MRSKSKSKIIFAILTIIVCVIVLASTSFALFTDTAEPIAVRVQAGKLDIDLLQADSNGQYVSLDQEPGNVFGDEGWEPGQTRVYYFKIVNNSEIKIKYSFFLQAEMMEMENAMEYAVFEDKQFEIASNNADLYKNATYGDLVEDLNYVSDKTYMPMDPGEVKYYAVSVRMKEESGNEYQGKHCSIDVFLHAYQGNAE